MRTLQLILLTALFAVASLPATAQQMPMKSQEPSMRAHHDDTTDTAAMMNGQMMGMMHCPMMHQHMAAMKAMSEEGMGMMGMMHENMMKRGMDDPMAHASMMVEMLPTMKDALDLSDAQVAELVELARLSNERQSELAEQSSQAEAKAAELLGTKSPDPSRVKALFREAAMHGADAKAERVETFIRMKAQLGDDQRRRLTNMTGKEMHQHAMSHMSMMQMMKMMHADRMPGCMKHMK